MIVAAHGETLSVPDRPLDELFEGWVERTPDAIAVRGETGNYTFAELDALADRLADVLRRAGVTRETRVAICMGRCGELVVALLGVLKAGGTFVPVDPDDPEARRDYILRDAAAEVILVASGSPPVTGADAVVVEVDLIEPGGADRVPGDRPRLARGTADAAYLLYTSGSTGQPKGVVVEHRQLTNYALALAARLGIDEPMSFLLVQPLTVDSSLTAIAVPLCTGGEIHVVSRERSLDAGRLADWCSTWGVDCLKIAPSHLRALQGSPRFDGVVPRRFLIVGGEASDWTWLSGLQRSVGCRVFNHYGPTETTVGVLTLEVSPHLGAEWTTAPIGVPLPNCSAHVVDPAGNEVPPGDVGELVIGGANVARGYHGGDDLARSSFFTADGVRFYRTGDHARRGPDGIVEFHGRRDDQIKVRGFRISLGEIDAVLTAHDGVRHAVTTVRDDAAGNQRLIAFVEPVDPAGLTVEDLERFLHARLPAHMIPRTIVPMDELPRSPHGKIDRAALPDPTGDIASGAPALAAGNDSEQIVSALWAELLGVEVVNPNQNFFDLGGHSLLLIELHYRLQARLGREFELLDLFERPTVRAQAELIARSTDAGPTPARPANAQHAALARRRRQQSRRRAASDG